MMGKRIVDRSVDTGNIDDTGLKTATVRQKIRDEYIRDATVTIVLIGPRTWQRRHVDWEVGSSIRKTKKNPGVGCWVSCFQITPIMVGTRSLTLT